MDRIYSAWRGCPLISFGQQRFVHLFIPWRLHQWKECIDDRTQTEFVLQNRTFPSVLRWSWSLMIRSMSIRPRIRQNISWSESVVMHSENDHFLRVSLRMNCVASAKAVRMSACLASLACSTNCSVICGVIRQQRLFSYSWSPFQSAPW